MIAIIQFIFIFFPFINNTEHLQTTNYKPNTTNANKRTRKEKQDAGL